VTSRRSAALAATIATLLAILVLVAMPAAPLPVARSVAAGPSPTPAYAGDPRSSGEGAGLVGQPLLALGAVLTIGLASAGVTLLYVRLTARRGRG
jgi:hypothetical protein